VEGCVKHKTHVESSNSCVDISLKSVDAIFYLVLLEEALQVTPRSPISNFSMDMNYYTKNNDKV